MSEPYLLPHAISPLFQTPYGALQLTMLPMGWTNSVPIFHDDITHILQPEIPHVT